MKRTAPLLALALLLAGCATPAPRLDCTVPEGDWRSIELHVAAGQNLSWEWTSSSALDFSVSGPEGDLLYDLPARPADKDWVKASRAGEHSITWWNLEGPESSIEYVLLLDGKAVSTPCTGLGF